MLRRPSVLIIWTDQQRGDCLGVLDPQLRTPNLDRRHFDALLAPLLCAARVHAGAREGDDGTVPAPAWHLAQQYDPAHRAALPNRAAACGGLGYRTRREVAPGPRALPAARVQILGRQRGRLSEVVPARLRLLDPQLVSHLARADRLHAGRAWLVLARVLHAGAGGARQAGVHRESGDRLHRRPCR